MLSNLYKTQKQFIPQEPYTLQTQWETPEFSKIGNDCASPCFKEGGHNWKIVVFKNGNGAGKGNSVSIFLLHPACKKAHPVTFSIQTVGGTKTASFKGEWVFSPILNNQGNDKFIPLSEVNDYLENDKLKFDLTITFDPPQGNGVQSSRKAIGVVGLTNLGATCYLNSMLENLFHTPSFRRAVYSMPTDGTEDPKKSIPLALQHLFTLMQLSPLTPTTSELTESFGWGLIDQFVQHDVQEFLRVLIDNLETKMKNTPKKDIFADIFRGNTITKLEAKAQNYKSEHKEDFYDIELVVRGNATLHDALTQFTQEEVIDDYKFDDQQDKVQAIRSTKFGDLPAVLHFHLQRFEYNPGGYGMIKVDDHFSFPDVLDLSEFVDESKKDQETKYELFGVLIHIGNGMGGHYEALMKVNGMWMLFNDDHVQVVPNQTIEQTFGSTVATAYFLAYCKVSEKHTMEPVSDDELPDHLKQFYAKWVEENTWKPSETKVDIFAEPSIERQLSSTSNNSLSPVASISIPSQGYKVKDCVASIAQLAGIKEKAKCQLYTVDRDGFPWSRINPLVSVADQFAKQQRVFATIQGFGEKGTQPFTVAFFDPNNSDALRLLFIQCLATDEKPSVFVDRVRQMTSVKEDLSAFFVSGTSCAKADLQKPVGNKTGMIVFQSAKPSLDMSVIKKAKEGDTEFRSVDLLPELRGLSVEKYLQSLQNTISVRVISIKDRSREFNILISGTSHITLLTRCIRAVLGLPPSDGLLMFRKEQDNEPSEEPIKTQENANIKQLVPGSVVFYIVLNGVAQKDLETKAFFQPDVCIDSEKTTSPALLMKPDFNGFDVLEKLFAEKLIAERSGWRILMLIGSRIVKQVDLSTKLGTFLSNKFRIERIPDDQKPPAKTVRVTFSTNTRDPRNSTTGHPFLLTLVDGEKFEDTKKKIIAESGVDPEKTRFGYSNGTSAKYNNIKDDDVTSEKIEANGMLYVFVPGTSSAAKKRSRINTSQEFRIYN